MTGQNKERLADSEGSENGRLRVEELNQIDELGADGAKFALIGSERELLRELVQALRTIRFGSIVLTIHDGQLVEINKSIRIRRGPPNRS